MSTDNTKVRCLILHPDGLLEEVVMAYVPKVGDAFPGACRVGWVIEDRFATLVRLIGR